MPLRIMLIALVLVTGCTHRIEFKPENSEQAKIEKATLKVENLVAKLKEKHDAEEYIGVLPNTGREFTELPAPHPIDLPETHPADLPDAEPCPSHPRDLPIGEPRAAAVKSIGVYEVGFAQPIYVPAAAYQYLISPAYQEYGKPPTVNETTGIKTYYPTAPGVFEMDAIKATIGLDLTRQQLERTKSDLVDAKLEIIRQREQLRDLEIDVKTLKSLVGELLKRK